MKFKLEFTCDNSAFYFDDKFYPNAEIERILDGVAYKVGSLNLLNGLLVDINGATIGSYKLIKR